jgi:sortase A
VVPLRIKTLRFRVLPEGFLLTVGLALLFIYTAARIDRFLAARQFEAITQLTSSVSEGKPSPVASKPVAAEVEESPQRPVVEHKAGDPVGVLRIARIHLEVPVLEGTSALTLNRGAGRIEGTAQPGEDGNIGIAGHRDSFFRGLKDVQVGDAIELGTPEDVSTYVVDRIQVVPPDRVDVLQPSGRPSLTLITCYPFHFFGRAPERYVVTALLAGSSRTPSAGADAAASAAP